ncbi:hypothetical protein [Pyrobaculum sp.]|uniref:hypothetical protein n=1 Tax=Pyrobaculum sp. TaxID=2004705 RepID=UPI003D0963D7
MRFLVLLVLGGVLLSAGVLYVDMSRYVVEVETACGPSYIFTAPLDDYVNLHRWLEEVGLVERYDSPIRKKAREALGVRSEENATPEQWNALVNLSLYMMGDKLKAVEEALRKAGVEVLGVGPGSGKPPIDKANNGTVVAFVRLGGRGEVLKELEGVAAAYNISIVVVDLPRVRAFEGNKTVDSVPGLGAPAHGLVSITIFGRFGDVAYYVGKPDGETVRSVARYLRERELCGVAVVFVPSERYIPRLAPAGGGGPGERQSLLLAALAAVATLAAAALLLHRGSRR